MYPDDCLQTLVGPDEWWVTSEKPALMRGALIRALVPHVDQVPYQLTPEGRTESTEHGSARASVARLRVGSRKRVPSLPVAAMPLHPGEIWAAYRAKVRPCLVISHGPAEVDRTLTRGRPNYQTAGVVTVAPAYGVRAGPKRIGYRPELVERIRHCTWPHFLWDMLPLDGESESVFRLDQIQPVGAHHESFQHSGYMLSDAAMGIVDDLLFWLLTNRLPGDSDVAAYIGLFKSL